MHWYTDALKQYAVFSGRATRQAYWMFFLINFLISVVLGFVLGFISPKLTIIANLYSLAVFLPSLGIGIRRLHDSDHSGWWILVPIVNLVFLCTQGTPGDNRFGPEPVSEA